MVHAVPLTEQQGGQRLARRIVGFGLLLVGGGLLLVAALGEWGGAGSFASSPIRSGERFDPALPTQTRSVEALYRAAEARVAGGLHELPPDEAMQVLFDIVADRFTDGAPLHTPFTNWILWVLGRVHPAFATSRDPDLVLKHGHEAACGEISYVLLRITELAGIRPRHVGLFGHVVMEAWYDDGWHMYDPNFEVIPRAASGSVLSVSALSSDPSLVRQAYAGRASPAKIESLVRIITSRNDNSFVSYPIGAQFEWKSQVLMKAERVAEWLKFIIPGIVVLVGGVILGAPRRDRV